MGPTSLDGVALSASRLEKTSALGSITCKVTTPSANKPLAANCAESHEAYRESKALRREV